MPINIMTQLSQSHTEFVVCCPNPQEKTSVHLTPCAGASGTHELDITKSHQ